MLLRLLNTIIPKLIKYNIIELRDTEFYSDVVMYSRCSVIFMNLYPFK